MKKPRTIWVQEFDGELGSYAYATRKLARRYGESHVPFAKFIEALPRKKRKRKSKTEITYNSKASR